MNRIIINHVPWPCAFTVAFILSKRLKFNFFSTFKEICECRQGRQPFTIVARTRSENSEKLMLELDNTLNKYGCDTMTYDDNPLGNVELFKLAYFIFGIFARNINFPVRQRNGRMRLKSYRDVEIVCIRSVRLLPPMD